MIYQIYKSKKATKLEEFWIGFQDLYKVFDQEILENQKLIQRIDFLQAKVKYFLAHEYTIPKLTDKK
ncbi:hypothetical protein BIFGAL_04473 [Bifidobacterium gallicum DSM 20093 = LMG 11596]|uniref:Uncharacterized protein n=1 Tax=Bifidobacterium gallicum DSM 20093 = LMG 11596 TaxID=561180 RepID=D1NX65_9BIFI|nr:hypothetical protein [Bifidobacterium gallicum]EFA22027.1 hypothetical protein BIFGAL_04473 [Bifidobacterium gallicum DSM 20093 = LMG 11596]